MATVTRRTMSPELAARFERDVLPYQPSLQRSAFRLTRHAQDAEDLVQETLARACAGYHHFRPGTNLRAWLHTILQNTFISGYRKRQREPMVVIGDSEQLCAVQPPALQRAATQSAEDQALARMPAEELTSALRALPEEFRRAVYLIDVEGLTYRETAAVMGTPIGTVMSRLHRGRTSLRSQLLPAAS
ncbi:MAG TPA: sigma-70 family RNA polymerase sigma factor [Streptosporangiaceae bacterium]